MESINPITISEVGAVDRRLTQLQLEREKLVAAGHHALAAASSASPLHPANAAGMFGYMDGVKGLRAENLGGNWEFFREEGVEGISNDQLKVRVLFANVNQACGKPHPKARSRKGAGSERVACGDMFEAAGLDLPVSVVKFHGDYKTYYLMVDQSGAMELSLPVVKNGQFLRCIERIFLIEGGNLGEAEFSIDEPSSNPDLDVVISRK
ncbi:hypothetical protein CN157_19470 [Sinorhizobium meliloti]|uniref:hypothetical protein n=1 Tax=Rhizobium meliloti TaxID=382 RepID=UPI000FD7BAEB|nr:hypothetical protein [Sinorhizobium meliloti]RVK74508.1 hypothetical protein CN157_19470 [Sinorhizobium meliloti]RVM18990.1 hypothetical protein CN142_02925 [Sinorhizobium meliloti]RVQ76949.1 hypothetical protein CN061_10675 [Sinorhizobium meliloti]